MSIASSLNPRSAIFAAGLILGNICGAHAAIVERPAPLTRPAPAMRPGYDLAQTLNAMIAAQLAAQNRPDQSNPYRVPRPRPDREYLTGPAPVETDPKT